MKIKTVKNAIVFIHKMSLSCLSQSPMTSSLRRCIFMVAMTSTLLLPGQGIRTQTINTDACAVGPGSGTESDPYNKLSIAADAAAPGSSINLKCGNYTEPIIINKPLTLTASGGTARIGLQPDHLCAGVNNGDMFDVPDEPNDQISRDMTLGAMLDELAAANLRVIRILIDYRLDLDENGNALPIGEYNDCILEAIDNLMAEVRKRGLLLLIAFESHNWTNDYYLSRDWYSWRRCKTPVNLYNSLASDPNWEGDSYSSPHAQRVDTGLIGENYFSDESCKDIYKKRVEHILNHRNPFFNNKKWKDINDVVWAWAVHSEPEHMGDNENLVPWFHEMSSYVKGIDPDTYLAMGTMWYFLEHNFADVDIYTIHLYPGIAPKFDEEKVLQFRSPQGIGGKYGKLLLIEEINGGEWFIQDKFENFEKLHLPWMIWEYDWNGKQHAVWPRLNKNEWDIIVQHANNNWNISNCACNSWTKPWLVGKMVEALISP